jgi:hypothetical protein
MNKNLTITFRTFSIWVMTALFNGIFLGIYFAICEAGFIEMPIAIFIGVSISLFLSVPGFFIFWMVMLSTVAHEIYGRELFKRALSTGVLLATATSIAGFKIYHSMLYWYVFPASIIISTIITIMIHSRLLINTGRWDSTKLQ